MHSIDLISCKIHYNRDLSGNVKISLKDSGNEFEVLGADLVEFVGQLCIDEKIKELEDMTGLEFLESKISAISE